MKVKVNLINFYYLNTPILLCEKGYEIKLIVYDIVLEPLHKVHQKVLLAEKYYAWPLDTLIYALLINV